MVLANKNQTVNFPNETLKVAVLGLGAIGEKVASYLARGELPGFSLHSITLRDSNRAKIFSDKWVPAPRCLSLDDAIEEANIVVECLPPSLLVEVATKTLKQGKILVPCSVGGIFSQTDLAEIARQNSARIFLPCGALAGLDGIGAASLAGIKSASLKTEKPVSSFEQNEYLHANNISLSSLKIKTCIYQGNAADAIKFFPKNINVAGALCLSGVREEQLDIELWACPGSNANRHTISVSSNAGLLNVSIENYPDANNPKTSSITAYSVISTLKRISSTILF